MSDTKTDPKEAPKKPKEDKAAKTPEMPKEIGGREGPEPTRYGDWETGGRCTDF